MLAKHCRLFVQARKKTLVDLSERGYKTKAIRQNLVRALVGRLLPSVTANVMCIAKVAGEHADAA